MYKEATILQMILGAHDPWEKIQLPNKLPGYMLVSMDQYQNAMSANGFKLTNNY